MENNLCVQCKKRPIFIKKWSLCAFCYGWTYRNGQIPKRGSTLKKQIKCLDSIKSPQTINKYEHLGELEFARNFFTHNNWIPQPAQFSLNGLKYTPDFYDVETNTFIEVSRTRQAYSLNKAKYKLLRELFPKLNFEIRRPSGELLNEDSWDKAWEQ